MDYISIFDPQFLSDLNWRVRNDKRTAIRVLTLVEAITRQPYTGIGKPEALKYLTGVWSRRITQEHRLVYRVTEDRIEFLLARYHY